MKGAGLSRRRTSPPQASQVVSGASEILWRTSNTRWQVWHSYSYVGTRRHGTCRGPEVSRRAGSRGRSKSRVPGAWLGLLLLALAAAGCSVNPPGTSLPAQRLQARATYERGLSYLGERQPAPALAAFREAVALDGTV